MFKAAQSLGQHPSLPTRPGLGQASLNWKGGGAAYIKNHMQKLGEGQQCAQEKATNSIDGPQLHQSTTETAASLTRAPSTIQSAGAWQHPKAKHSPRVRRQLGSYISLRPEAPPEHTLGPSLGSSRPAKAGCHWQRTNNTLGQSHPIQAHRSSWSERLLTSLPQTSQGTWRGAQNRHTCLASTISDQTQRKPGLSSSPRLHCLEDGVWTGRGSQALPKDSLTEAEGQKQLPVETPTPLPCTLPGTIVPWNNGPVLYMPGKTGRKAQ